MKNKGLSLAEVFVVIVIIAFLFSLVPVSCSESVRAAKITQCTSNMKQIGTLAEVYRKTFGGPQLELPSETGEAWHLCLIRIMSENDNSVFQCPAAETHSPTGSDYRGPAKYANVADQYPRLTLPIIADKCPGGKTQHFGDNREFGVNALTKGYQVTTVREGDARWADFGPDSPYLKD